MCLVAVAVSLDQKSLCMLTWGPASKTHLTWSVTGVIQWEVCGAGLPGKALHGTLILETETATGAMH